MTSGCPLSAEYRRIATRSRAQVQPGHVVLGSSRYVLFEPSVGRGMIFGRRFKQGNFDDRVIVGPVIVALVGLFVVPGHSYVEAVVGEVRHRRANPTRCSSGTGTRVCGALPVRWHRQLASAGTPRDPSKRRRAGRSSRCRSSVDQCGYGCCCGRLPAGEDVPVTVIQRERRGGVPGPG